MRVSALALERAGDESNDPLLVGHAAWLTHPSSLDSPIADISHAGDGSVGGGIDYRGALPPRVHGWQALGALGHRRTRAPQAPRAELTCGATGYGV